ncbi:acetate/propionate family kinase [Kaistia dalseonensis]|uniref:Acetate kinase n=1 Tax=Kaistia dalseonensis TaxID=410840 RepID=A0ABU0H8R4_9HYPH|nr:acetate/propionate family kinase [Kaistia dalseonensis]MCX5495659.1 acetate/propionate family kinase [Kaistia dalseonensis]MDQ0438253.1 acetate kinase [Kaistia dalseonensis]
MTADLMMTFNAGSSTVKVGLFEMETGGATRVARGVIDFRAKPLSFRVTEGPVTFAVDLEAEAADDLTEVLAETLGWLTHHFDMDRIAVIGHRIVHGGDIFDAPVVLDDRTIQAIDDLTPLAPLHQPQSLRLIRAIRKLRPDIEQVASFDTAFHRTNAPVVRRFAIPRALHDEGIKRYGFHGLSYKFIAGELKRCAPEVASRKVIAAHLGSGASLCGFDEGASRDVSMSFSTLDGIPMATRCGALDPGVMLHLLGQKHLSPAEIEDMLYHRSGLLGVSGISADSRDLIASDRPEAKEALDLFTFRIAGEIGRIAMSLGGLDAIVFTAGIGEHQPEIRSAVCARLGWLGAVLDPAANEANVLRIADTSSRIQIFVIPTDEEQVIADEAVAIIQTQRQTIAEKSNGRP